MRRVDGNRLVIERPDDEARSRALHGLYRALSQNMVDGVTKGFEKKLDVVGVSYQASVEGDRLRLRSASATRCGSPSRRASR